MSGHHHQRNKRALRAWTIGLIVIVVTILVLTLSAHLKLNGPERAAAKRRLAEARTQMQNYCEEVKRAREHMPSDSGIPKDWDCEEQLSQWVYGARLEMAVSQLLLTDPLKVSAERLAPLLTPETLQGTVPAFMRSADPQKGLSDEECAQARRYICDSPGYRDVVTAFHLGLCGDLFSRSRVNVAIDAIALPLAAHAVCLAAEGKVQEAVDACVFAYQFVALGTRVPSASGACDYIEANAVADQALQVVAELVDLSSDDWNRLFAEIDPRRSSQAVASAFRAEASRREMGTNYDFRDRQSFVGRTGDMLFYSGAVQLADDYAALLDRKPYEGGVTFTAVAELQKHRGPLSTRLAKFRRFCASACALHAEDVARVDAAHLASVLKAWKKTRGKYPAKLDDLSPKPPEAAILSPDTGRPVEYSVLENGGFTLTVQVSLDGRLEPHPIWVDDNRNQPQVRS